MPTQSPLIRTASIRAVGRSLPAWAGTHRAGGSAATVGLARRARRPAALSVLLVLGLAALLCSAASAPAAESPAESTPAPTAKITINAERTMLKLSDLMIGANMEDLHYQMTGGISSQLVHGESFFEPSPTQLATKIANLAGFANCGGTLKIEGGELAAAKGSRLTSAAPSPATETGVEMKLPPGAADGAGLAVCVSPLNADDKWEWYSGYTAEVTPKEVILRKAARANKHVEVKKAPLALAPDAWVALAVRVEGKVVTVLVDGKEVLKYEDDQRLPLAHYALVAKGDARFRNLWQTAADGKRTVALEPNPLLATPGDAVSLRWAKVQTDSAQGSFALETEGTWHPNCPSQTVTFTGGKGEWGIDNAGLKRWGIAVAPGKPYEGFLRVKAARPTEAHVSLRSADGKAVYASQALAAAGNADEYQRIAFTLTPSTTDGNARFAITLKKPGTITLGYVFLQPGEWGRYKGLPIRKDLAEALVAQGIRVLRYNGGMIERPDYRWKNMQGPRDQRPPYDGFYDRYCSNGFGVIEIIQFCEAAGLEVVPALNLDETPEDVANFIAYCNAPADTPAGRRRAIDGHPQPYGLRYYQVANESALNEKYVEKFKQVAEAIWKVDPNITLLPVGKTYTFKPGEKEEDIRRRLALHLDLTQFMHARGKKLLWDCHAFNTSDDPAQALGGQVPGAIEFSRWLTRLDPSLGVVPVGLLEFNAGRFDYGRGLAHALEMNVTHRAGDCVRAAAMPNVSQPWGVYQTDWKAVLWTQGNIYYTQTKVWFQPAYYVDQMIARNWAPNVVACQTQTPQGALDVLAARTENGQRLVLRVVNLATEPMTAEIAINGFTPSASAARVEELTGKLPEYNTRTEPERIKPVIRQWLHQVKRGKAVYTFPAHSFTVIVLQ
jgi:alpha-L-arabinofuranosidase